MERERIEELLAPFAAVTVKRMFGGQGVYAEGLFFALEAEGEIYLKVDATTQPLLEAAGSRRFVYRKGSQAVECYTFLMKREKAISQLKEHEAELKRLGVEHLYMFGSTARGEAKEDSDIDLFFDYEKGNFGLFELMDVKERATSILGHKADIMTRSSLHPLLKERIEKSAVCVF